MKSAIILLAAVVVILFLPASLTAINDFRMTDFPESHLLTTTNVTTSSVTLTQAVFNDSLTNISLSSNNTGDAPLATSYTAATKTLALDGLQTGVTRNLIVTYKINALTDYTGGEIATRVWPLCLILGVIGLIVAAVYNATKHGE